MRSLPFPPALAGALGRLGDLLAPLALISVGLQLRFDAIASQARLLGLGGGSKPVACPALVVAVLWLHAAAPDMVSRVSVIEAAMPPMIGVGIPLGPGTAMAWHGFLGWPVA